MKNIFTNPKFKRGSLAVTVTLLTVVAIIVLNVLFSAFAQRFGWYGDMTTEYLFSLSDDCTFFNYDNKLQLTTNGGKQTLSDEL